MKLNTRFIIQLLIFVIVILLLWWTLNVSINTDYYASTSSRQRSIHFHYFMSFLFVMVWLFLSCLKNKFVFKQSNAFWKKSSKSSRQNDKAEPAITLDTQLQNPDNDYQFTDIQKSDNNTYVLNYKQKTSSKKVQFKAVDSNKNNVLEPTEIIDCRVIDKKP